MTIIKFPHLSEAYSGIPPKPNGNAYNAFVKKFKTTYKGHQKEFMQKVSIGWKSVTDKEKAEYQKQADKVVGEWIEKMHAHIKTLPKEQQPMMLARYNLHGLTRKLQLREEGSSKRIKKEKLDQSLSETKPRQVLYSSSDEDEESAKKAKKRKIDSTKKSKAIVDSESEEEEVVMKSKTIKNEKLDQSLSKTKPRPVVNSSSDEDEDSAKKAKKRKMDSPQKSKAFVDSESKEEVVVKSPKKKQKNGEGSPQKLQDLEELSKKKINEPEYPSQSTAHYFMSKVFKGKESRVAKAYKKLDPEQKKIYKKTFLDERKAYLMELVKYLKSLPEKEKASYRHKLDKFKQAQKEATKWHVDHKTDVESNNDDDSDSSD